MAISEHWVGEIPSQAVPIELVDNDNTPVSLSSYSGFTVKLLGSDNEEIDLTGSTLLYTGVDVGVLTFRWPLDRSVFNKPGEYLLQIELTGANGSKEYTDAHTIRVRKFGGKN